MLVKGGPGNNVPTSRRHFSKWLTISRAMSHTLSADLVMHLRVSWAVLTGIINATIPTNITCRCVRRRSVTLANSNTQLIILTSGELGCDNIWRQHGSTSWPVPNDDVLTHWWGWSSMLQAVIYARVGNKLWNNIVKKFIRLWQEFWIDVNTFAGSDFDKKFELVIFCRVNMIARLGNGLAREWLNIFIYSEISHSCWAAFYVPYHNRYLWNHGSMALLSWT